MFCLKIRRNSHNATYQYLVLELEINKSWSSVFLEKIFDSEYRTKFSYTSALNVFPELSYQKLFAKILDSVAL